MPDDPRIADLRWPVIIARREQAPAAGGEIQETLTHVARVRADIQPIGTSTFWGTQATDAPVTHSIRMRWIAGIDNTYVILRETLSPLNLPITELYRVRRTMDLGGRKRWLLIQAELEVRE